MQIQDVKTTTKSEAQLFRSYLDQWTSRAEWVGIRRYHETTQSRSVRNEKPEENLTFEDQGVMIEVMANGHVGYYGTSDLSPDGLNRAFSRALATTQSASAYSNFKFKHHQSRPKSQGEYSTWSERPLSSLTPKQINEFLSVGTKALNVSDEIIDRVARVFVIETKILLMSSSGTHTEQKFQKVSFDLSATAAKGTDSQTRSWNGGFARCYQAGAEIFDLKQIQEAGRRIGQEAVELLHAENCPVGVQDLILMPDQMTLQIHESIGHPLELDRILGDERNYAGSSFVKLNDFGNLQYGSKLMNATFDPTDRREFASYAFDDSGHAATKEHLIKDGVLVAGLGSLESQVRSGIKGVANFRSASWNRAPIDRMANINLEAGTSTLSELINSVDEGVLMHANRSWSIDDYRRKFQFGCEYGQKIKGGKIVGTVKNPNYRGTTVPFWNNLAGLANQVENFGSPFCGKGEPSQVIRVGHRSPASLFKNIEIFGGSK